MIFNSSTEGRKVISRFQDSTAGVFLDQDRLQRETEAGFWPDRLLTDHFDRHVREHPQTTALIAYRRDNGNPESFTYAALDERVSRVAANLVRLGVGPGDVVSYQLPNGWQFVTLLLACIRIGAVSNPLMPIFRFRELEFMIGLAESKLLVVPAEFRNFNHAEIAGQLQQKLPHLDHIVVVDGVEENSFDRVLLNEQVAPFVPVAGRMQPDDIMKLMYTSGTTGEPKGVMHTNNTLLVSVEHVSDRLGLTGSDVFFVSSPFAHSFGYVYGIMMSVYLGAPLITMDVWDPGTALAIMDRHAATFSFGAPSFLSDLITAPGVSDHRLEPFRLFLASGAPVPPALVDRAGGVLEAEIATAFGMTELGIVSATSPAQPEAGRGTDGFNLPFCELRIVDENRQPVPAGCEGSLQCRSSTAFLGYYKRPDLYTLDAAGWFDTGDLAVAYANGYIRIVGRTKDIIIRGGENIPVVELEKLIFAMPQVSDVALVSMPDPRLGERACAFVTLNPGRQLSLRDITDYLEDRNVARQYLPERLEIIDEMPRTPSGKIQKFLLRRITTDFTSNDRYASAE